MKYFCLKFEILVFVSVRFIHSSNYPFIHPSIYPYIHTSIYPFIHTSIYPFKSILYTRAAPITSYSKEDQYVPTVLAKWLRPHQREGVQFMYQCVMGMKEYDGHGCILADDMGLGEFHCFIIRSYEFVDFVDFVELSDLNRAS